MQRAESKSPTGHTDRLVSTELEAGRNLIFDREAGIFVISDNYGEDEGLFVPLGAFSGILHELIKAFGTGASAMLQKLGFSAGKKSAKHVTLESDITAAVKSLFNSGSRWGFGRYKLVTFNPDHKYIIFRLYGCPLGRPNDKRQYSYAMHYLVGFYKGFFSAVFRREMECKETKCLSLGHKYCEFICKPVYGRRLAFHW